jgi:hypothetical protein
MKVLITTSNKYLHLLVPFSTLFNKYWPGQDVTFLGFDNPNIPELPDNFNYVSLGKQSDFGTYWTNPIIPYINELEDDYFAITCEDLVLTHPIDLKKLNILEEEIKLGNVDKAMLDSHLNWNLRFKGEMHPYKEGILKLSQFAEYRTSLSPAIWRKEYFMRYCKPNMTIWDFELKNMPESQRDKATIISLDQDEWLLKYGNVYKKGKPWPHYDATPSNGKPMLWGTEFGIKKEDILFVYNYLPEEHQRVNKDFLDSLDDNVLHY